MVVAVRHGGDSGSTYDAEMFAVCGGVDIMDIDDLGGCLRDDMMSRTTMISGGEGCKVLGCATRLGAGQTGRACW